MERREPGFGPFILDDRRKLLLKDGVPVPLGQRGLALLEALLTARGRVVPKVDLMNVAWPGQSVEESNLSVQIAALRKCLGSRPDGRDWIVTVPRVGYQLIDIAPEGGTRLQAIEANANMPVTKPSIAVLPFKNLGGDTAQDYLSDGMTEDIITELSRIADLSVIARSPVMLLKGQHIGPQEIGERLNVTSILEGSVRRAENRIRISVQLVDCANGTSLWADRFDRQLSDIFNIQEEIARTIAAKLKVQLTEPRHDLASSAPTLNMTAYDYCLQGRHFYHMHTTQHAVMAKRMFRKAVEFDRNYARAYAGLAFAGSFLYALHHPEGQIDEILAASGTAMELEPNLAEAHAAHGLALVRAGRPRDAIAAFERAIALNSSLFEAHYHFTEALTDLQDWERAAVCYRRALEIAPEDYRCQLMLGQMYWCMARVAEAVAADRAGVAYAERALSAHPDVPLAATLGAGALARLGEKARALEWVERALTIAPDDSLTHYNSACCLATLGERQRAVDLLELWAVGAHQSTLKWLETDFDLDSVRDHPRFVTLLKKIEGTT